MKPNEIVKDIMELRGFSNQSLATKLGKSTASAVSNPLSRENGMRIDTLMEMVEAMDCEVVVRSTLKDKSEWIMKRNGQVINKVDLDTLLSDSEEQSKSKIKLTKEDLSNENC